MNTLYDEMKNELKNILTFWSDNDVDKENGGFYGCIKNDLSIEKNHIKSGVLTTRILWTFSCAYSELKDNKYLSLAKRAYDYLINYFLDKEYGGIYTSLNFDGSINNSEKQVYYQAFAIYALSEYYKASSDENAIKLAFELYNILETTCKDDEKGGYFNAYSREWNDLDDTSLSEKDMNCDKIMNTCLHILEAYTNLYRVSRSDKVKESLKDILLINLDKILDNNSYKFNLYFDKDWMPLSSVNSFGHDIEGSWLICEAAELLDDKELKDRVFSTAVKMADEVLKNGISDSGEIYAEAENGKVISDSTEWWMFAEAVVGLYNAYQITGAKSYLDHSEKVWEFTKAHLIDRNSGEWFWGIKTKSYEPFGDDLVSEWKCPYHNSRMCIEIMNRIESASKICKK